MTGEHDGFEYDIAVSFAGEQRDYVEAVVRGLGSDIRVFYDKDAQATLWGENLHDYLTDIYQRKARYVVMFVSAAYATKTWTNVERQAAMATAMKQRGQYILPVRMDDTELPGLLTTIGYVDTRFEGLSGVIKLILEKLGQERAGASYTGRVPASQADIALLLAVRPNHWEYWLFAGALRVGLEALEEKYRDYWLGFASLSGTVHLNGQDAMTFLREVLVRQELLLTNFNAVFASDALTQAFGPPGEPGDAALIKHLASRFLNIYETFMDEAAYVRGTYLPEEFQEAKDAVAEFGKSAVAEMRAFVHRCIEVTGSIPELVAEHDQAAGPLHVDLTVTLTIDPAVVARFHTGLQRAVAALGS